MSVPEDSPQGFRKGNRWGRGRGGKISLDGPPTPQELAEQPHRGDAADRFSLFTPAQIEQETRNARIELSFGEMLKIRDQAEMVVACMQIIIGLTRAHDMGSIRQRIEARREMASLGERLSILNGKTPYGYSKKKP